MLRNIAASRVERRKYWIDMGLPRSQGFVRHFPTFPVFVAPLHLPFPVDWVSGPRRLCVGSLKEIRFFRRFFAFPELECFICSFSVAVRSLTMGSR
jgi:hypothetical protein